MSVVLGDAFPEAPMAIFYLAGEPGGQDDGTARKPGDGAAAEAGPDWPPLFLAAASASRILPRMAEPALVDAIRALTATLFPADRAAAAGLAREFSAIARREPIELEPGVLLLHAHSPGLRLPSVAIGARREGWPLSALRRPVTVVVALCSPAEAGPATHLEALTQVATAFRDGDLARRLLSGEADGRAGGLPPRLA